MSLFQGFALGGGSNTKPTSSDSDVQAYIDAVYDVSASLSPTEVDAIEYLIGNLKTDFNLWTDLNYIFPFCGNNLDAKKINAKTPNDTGSYLEYGEDWIVSKYGIQSDGDAYLDILSGSSPTNTDINDGGIIYMRPGTNNSYALFGNYVSGSIGGQMFMNLPNVFEDDFPSCGASIPGSSTMYSGNWPCGTSDKNILRWFENDDVMNRVLYQLNISGSGDGSGDFYYRAGTVAEISDIGTSTPGRMTINGAYDSVLGDVRYQGLNNAYAFIATTNVVLSANQRAKLFERTEDFMEKMGRTPLGYSYPAPT